MFATMRRGIRNRSQCYNRAHVWAWELNKKVYNDRKIQVGKIWLFFTRKYIREYRYKWWFHVSPFVDVNSELRVMDRKFTKGPLPEKTWTDIFIYSKQRCTEVYKYSDYRDHQFATHCYVIKSSLYYWQPYQVDNVERADGDDPQQICPAFTFVLLPSLGDVPLSISNVTIFRRHEIPSWNI